MQQPPQGVKSGSVPKQTTDRPEIAYILSGDFGNTNRGLAVITSMAEFYERHLKSITVAGQTIQVSQALPPTPEHLTKHLINRPNSRYMRIMRAIELARELADDEARTVAAALTGPRQQPALPAE